WYPDKLAVQIDLLRSCDAPLVYGAFDLVREDGSATGNSRKVPAEVDYATLLRANVVGCLTAIFDRERAGTPLMPDIRMRQDWGLWLRILRETSGVARAVPESVAALRIRPGSLSSNKLKATWYSYVLLARIEEQGALRAARNIVAHNVWRLLAGRT
ncbi:MAG TPA: hypothetical protein VLA56_03370, partial [Pseudomonadales bacterium]|nr:hypothetical protein [Pseudomonadales bacterium]